MKLKNKKVLVYGLGDSGRAVIKLLKNNRANVSFYDDNIRFFEYVGFERNPWNKQYDLVVLSPGVKCQNNKLLQHFEEKKIPVISEIDLAYKFSKGKIVAITGTNGKTTVSMLCSKILQAAGYKTFLCGNIGLPFSAVCEKTTKKSVVVCEVSNFQLESSRYFRADVSCILNIKPDHLDRHGSFEEYVKVKGKIADNLKRKDVLVVNLDDEEAKKMILHKNFKLFSKQKLKKGTYIDKGQIKVNKKSVLNINAVTLKGEKNMENVLASVCVCSNFKVGSRNFAEAVYSFKLAAHRMEEVGVIDCVTYIDDSKATNVASTLACLESFKEKPCHVLLGGQGKDICYDDIFEKYPNLKGVFCFGEERENILNSAKKFNVKAEQHEKFKDAVICAIKNAQKGDYVLLSPACASFDEFSSYAERGDVFKSIVLGDAHES